MEAVADGWSPWGRSGPASRRRWGIQAGGIHRADDGSGDETPSAPMSITIYIRTYRLCLRRSPFTGGFSTAGAGWPLFFTVTGGCGCGGGGDFTRNQRSEQRVKQ